MLITTDTLRDQQACSSVTNRFLAFTKPMRYQIDVPEWTASHQLAAMASPLVVDLGHAWVRGILPRWPISSVRLHRFDFSSVALDRLEIRDSRLTRIDFSRSGLDTVHILRCFVRDSLFDSARMYRSVIRNTQFLGSRFFNTYTHRSSIAYTHFTRCILRRVCMERTSFENVTFSDCTFDHGTLYSSELLGSHAFGVSFVDTSFRSTRGFAVRFHGCDFSGADFQGAELSGQIQSCDFRGSNLKGADLSGCRIENVTFSRKYPAVYDSATKFPKGFSVNRRGGLIEVGVDDGWHREFTGDTKRRMRSGVPNSF